MANYHAKNLLVTGGAGFIGSNFIHYYLKQHPSAQIINLDLLTYAGNRENLINLADPERHRFVQGNITNQDLVIALLQEYQIDTIVHFAAESHVDRSINGPAPFIETNITGSFRLLEAARRVWLEQRKLDANQCRFHHISTDEVYGSLTAEDPAFTETTHYAPNSPYSASKASADHLVRAYFHTYGLPVTTSNCSNNYGPRQHHEKLIPTIIRCCLQQQAIPIYGNGKNIRDWLYVTDHCEAIDKIMQQGTLGETYNIGGNNELTNLEVVHAICELLNQRHRGEQPYQDLITYVTDRKGHDWRYAINNNKINQQLGWQPKESFTSGLEKTLDYYLELFADTLETVPA